MVIENMAAEILDVASVLFLRLIAVKICGFRGVFLGVFGDHGGGRRYFGFDFRSEYKIILFISVKVISMTKIYEFAI
jgi:hypothetical protein